MKTEAEEEAARRKKDPRHPAVMANLMRQAREEDYRRADGKQAFRRSFCGCRRRGWRLSVPRFWYPGDRWVPTSAAGALQWKATGGVDAETCLDTRPARSLQLPSIDPVFAAPAYCGMGNNLNQIARKINGGQWSSADGFRWWPRQWPMMPNSSGCGMPWLEGASVIVKEHQGGRQVPEPRWIICWERPPARRGHRRGKTGGGPGAYRRLAYAKKYLRRLYLC